MKRRTRFIIKEVYKDIDFYFAIVDTQCKSIDPIVEEFRIEDFDDGGDSKSRTKQKVIARARTLEFPIPSVPFIQKELEFVG